MKFLIELNDLSKSERVRLAKLTKNVRLLTVLVEEEEWKIKAAAAHNKNVTIKILEKLYQESTNIICENVLNPTTYDKVIDVLVEIAKNVNTPLYILQELSHHSDSRVKAAVLKNPNITLEIFQELLRDSTPEVRAAIVSNKRSTIEMFYEYFNDGNCNEKLKLAMAQNSKTPVDLLIDLIIDNNSNVSVIAIKNLRKKKK